LYSSKKYLLFSFFVLAVLLGFGFYAASTLHNELEINMRLKLLKQVSLLSETLNLKHVSALSATEADWQKPEYLRLKEQLGQVRRAESQYRFIYLLIKKPDGKVYFVVDDVEVGHESEAPAGLLYEEVPKGVLDIFDSEIPAVVGPYTDRWGSFVCAALPLHLENYSDKKVLLLADVDAAVWEKQLSSTFFSLILPFLFLFPFLIVGFLILKRKIFNSAFACGFWHYIEVWMVLVCGLVLSLWVGFMAYLQIEQKREATFTEIAEAHTFLFIHEMFHYR
jgi:hypothetical protein